MTGPGYSGRALAAKLGIRPGERVVASVRLPTTPSCSTAPAGVAFRSRLGRAQRFIHRFSTDQAELERAFPRLCGALADDGMLWMSWPKRASGVPD